jgi:hypothetical protein
VPRGNGSGLTSPPKSSSQIVTDNYMKTKLHLILLLSLFFVTETANSQNNIAISENAVWIQHSAVFNGSYLEEYWTMYKTSGHINILGKTYVKLLGAQLTRTGFSTYHQLGAFVYRYAFRNDSNNRAYLYVPSDLTEYLWYDFNLSVGDTLHNPSWYSYELFPEDTIVVTSIDTISYYGSPTRHFVFNNNQTEFPDLIQYSGFCNGFIRGNYSSYFEGWCDVTYYCPDTTMTLCPITITGIQNYEKEDPQIKVYPNPTTGQINIDFSNSEFKPQKILIKDLSGRIIRTIIKDIIGNHFCIDIDLPDGIYLLEFLGKDSSFVRLINVIK